MAEKVAIVTGGGQGIGEGIALRLAQDGYAVIVNGRTQTKLDNVVNKIVAAGGEATTFAGMYNKSQLMKKWCN